MSLVRKLKPDRNITGALVPLSMLPIFGIVSLVFGFSVGLITLAVLVWTFALFYLYVFLRTWNWPHLFVAVWVAFLGCMLIVLNRYVGTNDIASEFGVAYLSGLVFFGFGIIYLIVTRKLKWRGREIFELTGEPVEETGNGYTDRPRPVGKVSYSPEQIRSFARFAARHLIALPYNTSRNITLVPIKMGDEYGRLLGLLGDYRDATWVNFDIDGEVSVHIAQKDYLDYRQSLAFDQLCASLGKVFIDFCELYNKGEGIRIIDRLDDLKIGVLS
jgi:hypothetical protein